MKAQKRIAIITVTIVFLLATTIAAICERAAWDCPECGKKGNIGKFCGGCGHPVPTDDGVLSISVESESLTVGDIITFGTYPQTKEGTDQTSIEWIVLDVQDGKALLLSKYGLDAKPYDMDHNNNIWEQCSLRDWLNNGFLKKAFSDKQQSMILLTDINNSEGYGETAGKGNTRDQIFLLSYAEANRYLDVTGQNHNNMKSRVSPTAYAEAKGVIANNTYKTDDDDATGWWWLRSPGKYTQYVHYVAYVYIDGSLNFQFPDNDHGAVRPALWISLEFDNY